MFDAEILAGHALAAHLSAEEQVNLTMAIIVINGWNRLAVGFDLFAPELDWKQ